MIEYNLVASILTIAIVFGAVQGICAYSILAERKISAWLQERLGPNRVGPLGLLQPIADGVKFVLKEQVIPDHVDRVFYLVAPSIAVVTASIALCAVPVGRTTPAPVKPWTGTVAGEQQFLAQHGPEWKQTVEQYNDTYQFMIAPHLDIGFLFIFATGSLAAYAIVLGGWSSNNKYSLLGSLRASAQMISYEIPMGMAILGVVLFAGSLNPEKIIQDQADSGMWNIFYHPLACILFVTAVFAECNRLPFDLAETEQELVGGYHTEYSGMKFAFFFLGEYTHMVTTSLLVTLFFFGGWHFWGLNFDGFLGVVFKLIIFVTKMLAFIAFYMVIRWTIPRFRFDQLMGMAWKVFIPLTLINLLATLLVKHYGLPLLVLTPISLGLLLAAGWFTLVLPPEPQRSPIPFRPTSPTARTVMR